MQKGIIAKKLGMSQVFENNRVIPVTVLEAGPCVVVQKKTVENDGYSAIQLGYGDASLKGTTKPLRGHFEAADVAIKKYLREFKFADPDQFEVGDIVKADIFENGDIVDVVGTSKGKGYSGSIKRWNTHSLKDTHGSGPVHRHMGSLGAASSPSRVMKGRKLPGQLGSERVTIQNLQVVKVDSENNLIAVKGAVPGPRGGVIVMTDAVKKS